MSSDIAATISKAREHSIGDLLRRSAGREPAKLAVNCGNVSWTFAEMDAIDQIGDTVIESIAGNDFNDQLQEGDE